jgi:hypothetical protein
MKNVLDGLLQLLSLLELVRIAMNNLIIYLLQLSCFELGVRGLLI